MNKKISKLIVIMLLVTIITGILSPIAYASNKDTDIGDVVLAAGDMVVGLVLWPLRVLATAVMMGIETVTSGIAGEDEDVNVETILFNGVSLIDINFFAEDNNSDFSNTLKDNVASWYYTIRTIAIIASLAVLLYIAIRMAISTIASEKADFKRMLTDWLVGFALIFILHYIMILIIYGNNALVDVIKTTISNSGSSASTLTEYIENIRDMALTEASFVDGFAALWVYGILVCMNLAFLLMYIKRLIVVAFLVIISPLITITYAIDRVKDGKSQALDAWMKEFFWTIVIQPFHCVIYVVFVAVSFNALSKESLSTAILAIMCMLFIRQAEGIIKSIFGIKADNVGNLTGSMAIAFGAMALAGKGGTKATAVAGKVTRNAKVGKLIDTASKGGGIVGKTLQGASTATSRIKNSTMVQSSMKKLDDVVTKTGIKDATSKIVNSKTVKDSVKATVNGAVSWGKWSAKHTLPVVGATMGSAAVGGDAMAGSILGYGAGRGINDMIGNKYKAADTYAREKLDATRLKNSVDEIKDSINNMYKDKKVDENELKKQIRVAMKLDVNTDEFKNTFDQQQQKFVNQVQSLQARLKSDKEGEEFTPNESDIVKILNLKDTSNKENNK